LEKKGIKVIKGKSKSQAGQNFGCKINKNKINSSDKIKEMNSSTQ